MVARRRRDPRQADPLRGEAGSLLSGLDPRLRAALHDGLVIPAHPLALDSQRRLDERRQRALSRYYLAAGAGGLAVGVHTTQFEIRQHGLLEPVLALAQDEATRAGRPALLVAGLCGPTGQAVLEAELAKRLGYHAGLLSPGGLGGLDEAALLERTRAVAAVLPVVGFYLQPTVGGRRLSRRFWSEFVEIDGVEAIKIAPFDRYATLEVVEAVCRSSRRDNIALYTGNDDNILADLLTPFHYQVGGRTVEKHIVGGLLGHWAVWTRRAVEVLAAVKAFRRGESGGDLYGRPAPSSTGEWLALNALITRANAAIFDPAHAFAGCIPGIHEVLRRQGLMEGRWCLDPREQLSPGQEAELDRLLREHPELSDDDFVRDHLDGWLAGEA